MVICLRCYGVHTTKSRKRTNTYWKILSMFELPVPHHQHSPWCLYICLVFHTNLDTMSQMMTHCSQSIFVTTWANSHCQWPWRILCWRNPWISSRLVLPYVLTWIWLPTWPLDIYLWIDWLCSTWQLVLGDGSKAVQPFQEIFAIIFPLCILTCHFMCHLVWCDFYLFFTLPFILLSAVLIYLCFFTVCAALFLVSGCKHGHRHVYFLEFTLSFMAGCIQILYYSIFFPSYSTTS